MRQPIEVTASQWNALNRHLVTAKLASSAVHDARNTLQAISGMAELITLGTSAARTVEDRVNAIQQHCVVLGERLEAFRALQADAPRRPAPLEIARLTAKAVELRQTTWGRAKITCAVSVPEGILVHADGLALLRVLINLLLNAEASLIAHGGGRITITVDADDEAVRILVDDDGPGVSEAEEAHLFSTTRANGEIATGLWVSKGLAEENGGDLSWRGRDGARATFVLRLSAWRN